MTEAPGERLPTIRYCRNNVPLDVRQRLRESGFPVGEDGCLDCCGVCCAGPYLLVDGEIVTGAGHLDILEMLATSFPGGTGRRRTSR